MTKTRACTVPSPATTITPTRSITGNADLDALLLEQEYERADLADAEALEADAAEAA